MNDDNEIIKLACDSCEKSKSGTYKDLFGDLPSIICLPKMICKCGGDITLEFTSTYRA